MNGIEIAQVALIVLPFVALGAAIGFEFGYEKGRKSQLPRIRTWKRFGYIEGYYDAKGGRDFQPTEFKEYDS